MEKDKSGASKSIKAILISAFAFILASCSKTGNVPYDMAAQTEHFEIYCSEEDKEAFEGIAKELEQYCRRIETSLDINEPQKIKLAVYPSVEAFNEALDLPNDNKGILYGGDGQISTISPSAATGNMYPAYAYQASGVLPYVIAESAFNAPEYLLCGAANIEGGSAFDGKTALELAEKGLCDIKALKKMNDDELSADKENALCAYMLSEYIQSEFGKDTYIRLLKKPNIKSVLGMSEDELLKGCAEYIKKTYAEIPFDLRKETEHFKFYCDADDLSSIEDTVNTLEENYDRVTSDLSVTLSEKTDVVFFPTEEWFMKTAKSKNISAVEEDFTGFWHEGTIYLPSPAILTVASHNVPNTALHEFVHAVTYALNPDPEKEGRINIKMPYYLTEGIASYEAGGWAYGFMKANEAIRKNTFPTFDELEKMNSLLNREVYIWGSLFCEFVVKQYGQDKMVEILKTLNVETALEKSKEDIRSEWIEYLKKEYKINV